MKKTIFSISLILTCFISFSQTNSLKVTLEFSDLQQKLKQTKHEKILGFGNTKDSEIIISLPLLNGEITNFRVVEYSILPENSVTDVQTFYGEKVGDAAVTSRITLTKEKLMVSIQDIGRTIIIERKKDSPNVNDYEVYLQKKTSQLCGNIEEQIKNGRIGEVKSTSNYSYGGTLKTYKLALIVTNEFYANYVNDAGVNAEIVAIINNINGIYEKEIAVRLTLVSPSNPIRGNFFYKKTETTSSYLRNLTTVNSEINTRFGNANYDIGHCLHNSGGGVAGLGVVCNPTQKGRGWSGSTTASSILLFAHELGHQFNANHTFNGTGTGNCSVGNRSDGTAFEPGSGSTIMSYFGTCFLPAYDLSGSETGYFHTNSLERMSAYIISNTAGGTCGISSATGNIAPVASVGTAYTIPKNTPFKLKGTGTDGNNDALTFTWEQYDVGVVGDTGRIGHTSNSSGINAVNSTTAPLFRSIQSTTGERTFPSMAFVMNNLNNPPDNEGEDLSNVSRTLNFRMTVRDSRSGGGGAHCSALTVTVDATKGPISVTSPNTAVSIAAGVAHTVTWAVNSTNSLSADVKILLSIDGGASFPFVLVASTTNDGSQSVTFPSNIPNTTKGRIIVASNNNMNAEFFDASDVNFTITSTCLVASTFVCNDSPVLANEGSNNLNLGMTRFAGSVFNNNTKYFQNTDIVSRALYAHNNEFLSGCNSDFSNSYSKLIALRVSKTGNYSFSVDETSGLYGLFSVFNSSNFNCANFIGSNMYSNQQVFGSVYNRDLQLNACQLYYILVYTNTSFNLNISGPGSVFEEIPLGSGGLSYTYAAVNQVNNIITDISPSSNFTNIAAGNYHIYGLMYANGFSPNLLIGKTIGQSYALGDCILFSNNKKSMGVLQNPCATVRLLVHSADDITSGDVTKEASSGTDGKVIATNWITGTGTRATYRAKSIELNQGFVAEKGTVFRAEVGGCL
jgi:hypothetical protein